MKFVASDTDHFRIWPAHDGADSFGTIDAQMGNRPCFSFRRWRRSDSRRPARSWSALVRLSDEHRRDRRQRGRRNWRAPQCGASISASSVNAVICRQPIRCRDCRGRKYPRRRLYGSITVRGEKIAMKCADTKTRASTRSLSQLTQRKNCAGIVVIFASCRALRRKLAQLRFLQRRDCFMMRE